MSSKRRKSAASRFSSPFNSRPKLPDLVKSRSKGHGKIQKGEDKIPGFIPKEAILCGSVSNSIKALSKGRDGELLSIADGEHVRIALNASSGNK
jgi:hypothetical protein